MDFVPALVIAAMFVAFGYAIFKIAWVFTSDQSRTELRVWWNQITHRRH